MAEISCIVSAYRWLHQIAAPVPAIHSLHYDLFLSKHYWLNFGCFMSTGCHFNQLTLPNMQFLYREKGKHSDYQFAVNNGILGGRE